MTIITRNEAKAQGLLRYFTGKPCKHGHTVERRTSDGHCFECRRVLARTDAQLNPERNRQRVANWRKANPDAMRNWQKANAERCAFHSANRRANELQATPKWLTKKDWEAINIIYANCPKGYHVDHDIPLKGKFVCGLHVPSNLIPIPALDNIRKKNSYSCV